MPFGTGIARLNFNVRLWALACAIFGALLFSMGGAQAATVQYVYDELGRLVAVIDPSADVTEYTYDEVGNLLSVRRQSSAQVSIVSFTPSRGQVGQVVTILGTAFSPDVAQNQVRFNGTAAVVTSATPTTLVTTVPLGATTGPISVTAPSGSATSAAAFVVREAPQIASFSPAIGEPGGNLTLAGRGLGESDLSVIVNKSASQVISASAATSTSRIPTATGGKISVTTVLGTATTTDDLFIVPAPHAAADVVATARIAIGDPGRVLALSGGKVGLVLFDGVAGTSGIRVSLRDVTVSGGTFSVFRPDGTPLVSAVSFGTVGANLVLSSLPVTGTYGVLVVANAGAGGNVTVAASTGVANSLSVGETIVVSVAAGQTGSFAFRGTAGERLGLDITNVSMPSGGTVQVFRPDGLPLGIGPNIVATFSAGAGSSLRLQQLPLTGTYTVIVQPAGGGGSAQFTLWKDVADSLTIDAPYDLTMTHRNQQALLTFNGTAGQKLGVNIGPVTSGAGGTVQVEVARPGGGVLGLPVQVSATFAAETGAGIPFQTLFQTGVYTLVISGLIGTAQVTLWNEAGGALEVETETLQTVRFPNQSLRPTFTGAAGDFLGLDLADLTLASGGVAQGGTVQVNQPNGSLLTSTPFAATTGIGIHMPPLPVAGTYTVVVTPNSSATGTLKLTLWRDVSDPLTIDAPYDLTIARRNQQARLKFNGTAGQVLGVNISPLTLGAGGTVQVLAPNGGAIGVPVSVSATFAAGTGAGIRIQTLPVTGIYTVVIVPDNGATGTARVTVWNEAVGTLQAGTETLQTVRFPNEILRLSFTGAAGDFFGLDLADLTLASGGVAQGGTLQVLQPGGGVIGVPALATASFAATAGAGIRMQVLPLAGTYTVVVTPSSGATGTLKLTLWRDVPDPLTIDAPYDLTIAFRNQQARLKFNGTAGQTLGVNISPLTLGAGGTVQVLGPNGGAIGVPVSVSATFAAGTGAGIRIQTLPVTGTYTVVIVPNNGATGTARVTVWNEAVGTLQAGTETLQTVRFPNQSLRPTFTGAAGEFFGLDLADLTLASGGVAQGGTVQVIMPNGSPIGLPAAGSAGFPATTGAGIRMQVLPVAGTYTVVVTPNSGATGTLRLTLWRDVSDLLTLDAPYDLTIANRSQQARLRFDGTAGQNLGVNISPLTLGAGGTVQVIGPNGSPIGLPSASSATFAAGTGAGIRMQSLPLTGIYTVVIVPDNGAAGTARVTVWNEAVGALQVGTETVQTVRFPNEILRRSFTGAVGDALGLDLADLTLASGGVAQGGTVQVIGPNGTIGLPTSGSATFAATSGAGIHMQTLTTAGTYTVLVTTNGGATGTLKLTLWRDVPDPLTIGTPYTLAILYRSQAARLTFAGVAGDSLGVDLSNVTLPSGGTLQILQPNGSPLGLPASGSATFTTAGGVINVQTLPATGTHTLVITPSSSGTGGATVRVFRR